MSESSSSTPEHSPPRKKSGDWVEVVVKQPVEEMIDIDEVQTKEYSQGEVASVEMTEEDKENTIKSQAKLINDQAKLIGEMEKNIKLLRTTKKEDKQATEVKVLKEKKTVFQPSSKPAPQGSKWVEDEI